MRLLVLIAGILVASPAAAMQSYQSGIHFCGLGGTCDLTINVPGNGKVQMTAPSRYNGWTITYGDGCADDGHGNIFCNGQSQIKVHAPNPSTPAGNHAQTGEVLMPGDAPNILVGTTTMQWAYFYGYKGNCSQVLLDRMPQHALEGKYACTNWPTGLGGPVDYCTTFPDDPTCD